MNKSLPTKSEASTINVQYSPSFNFGDDVVLTAANAAEDTNVAHGTSLALQSSLSLLAKPCFHPLLHHSFYKFHVSSKQVEL